MTRKFIQPGEVIDFAAIAAILSGAVVLIGKRVGVALADIAAGETGPVQVSGVFEVDKVAGDAVTQGALLYWDAAASKMTTTVASNTLAGYAWKAAGAGVATVQIKLNG